MLRPNFAFITQTKFCLIENNLFEQLPLLQRPRGPQPLSMSAWLTSWITDQLQTDDGIFQKFSHRVVFVLKFPPIFHFSTRQKKLKVLQAMRTEFPLRKHRQLVRRIAKRKFPASILYFPEVLCIQIPYAHFKSVHTSQEISPCSCSTYVAEVLTHYWKYMCIVYRSMYLRSIHSH